MSETLTYEPLALPWQSGRKRGFAEGVEIAEIKGVVSVWACVTPRWGYAAVEVSRKGRQDKARRQLDGDDPDRLKQKCERVAGLLVAALGGQEDT
jgi:hypothetical protein